MQFVIIPAQTGTDQSHHEFLLIKNLTHGRFFIHLLPWVDGAIHVAIIHNVQSVFIATGLFHIHIAYRVIIMAHMNYRRRNIGSVRKQWICIFTAMESSHTHRTPRMTRNSVFNIATVTCPRARIRCGRTGICTVAWCVRTRRARSS